MTTIRLGLTPAEMKHLEPAVRALLSPIASLRDAWVASDDWHRRSLVLALKDVFATALVQEHRAVALRVLKHGVDIEQQNDLLNSMFPLPWGKAGGQ